MIWLLLVIFQFKHFVADYPLQGKFMLGKFGKYPDFILPLLAHVSVHGLFTFIIAVLFGCAEIAIYLAIFDMVVHFTMDRIKASPNMLGRYKALSAREYVQIQQMCAVSEIAIEKSKNEEDEKRATNILQKNHQEIKSNTYFWWSLGLDQMVHHLTDLAIVFFICS
jgi:hypothetical protein